MTKEIITYNPQGVCSKEIRIALEDEIIRDINFIGGCPGNLLGIRSLVIGLSINEVITKLKGIKCGQKPTSCPDQLAICLVEYQNSKKQVLRS